MLFLFQIKNVCIDQKPVLKYLVFYILIKEQCELPVKTLIYIYLNNIVYCIIIFTFHSKVISHYLNHIFTHIFTSKFHFYDMEFASEDVSGDMAKVM